MEQDSPANWRQSKRTNDDSGGEGVPLPLSASSSVTAKVEEGGDNVAHVEEGGDDVGSAAAGSVPGEIRCAAASSVPDTAEAASSSHDQLMNVLQHVVKELAEVKAEMRAMAAASENQPLRDAEQALQDERRKQAAVTASEEQALGVAKRKEDVAATMQKVVEIGYDTDVIFISEIQAAAAREMSQGTPKLKSKEIEDHVSQNYWNSKGDGIVKMKPSKTVKDKHGVFTSKQADGFKGLRLIGQTSSRPKTVRLKRIEANIRKRKEAQEDSQLQKLNNPSACYDYSIFIFSFEVEEGAEAVALDDFCFAGNGAHVSEETMRNGLASRGEVPGKSAAKPMLLLIQNSEGCFPLDFLNQVGPNDRDDLWQKIMHAPYPEHREWHTQNNGNSTRCGKGRVHLHQVAAAALPPNGAPVNLLYHQDGTCVVRRVSLEDLKRMLARRVGTLPLADGIADNARASAWTAFLLMHRQWLGTVYDPSSPSDPIVERGY